MLVRCLEGLWKTEQMFWWVWHEFVWCYSAKWLNWSLLCLPEFQYSSTLRSICMSWAWTWHTISDLRKKKRSNEQFIISFQRISGVKHKIFTFPRSCCIYYSDNTNCKFATTKNEKRLKIVKDEKDKRIILFLLSFHAMVYDNCATDTTIAIYRNRF